MLKSSCLVYFDMCHALFSVLIGFETIVSEYISRPKSMQMYLFLFIWNIASFFPDKILHHLKHAIMSSMRVFRDHQAFSLSILSVLFVEYCGIILLYTVKIFHLYWFHKMLIDQ